MHGLRQISPPTAEPVSLAIAKQHMRIDADFTGDDQLIQSLYLPAAREQIETCTKRAFLTQTWQLTLDVFPLPFYGFGNLGERARDIAWGPERYIKGIAIRLPRPRCLSVQSITYLDQNGNTQTVDPSTYVLDINSEPARIVPTLGGTWPLQDLYQPGSVAVTYTTGSYVQTVTDTLVVPAAVQNATTCPLVPTQAANFLALTSLQTVVAAPAQPAPITGYSIAGGVGQSNPAVVSVPAAFAGETITLTYTYAAVPYRVIQAILFLAAHFYQNREATSDLTMKELPMGVQSLVAREVFDTFGF